MSLARAFDKFAVIARRDLLIALRHRGTIAFRAVAILAELVGLYFLARAIGPQFRPDGMDYFSFLLIGTAFYGLLVAGVGYFISAIQEAQLTGTLELLMSTATPPSAVVLLSAFSVFAGRAVETAVYLVAGVLLFGVSFTHPNVPSALLIFVLSLVAIVALGVLASALQIAIQRGAAVTWLVSTAIAPFSGMMFPVSSLPAPLQKVAALVPIAYSIDGLRQSLVNGAGVALLAKPIFALVIFAAVLLPASFLALKYVLRKAQRDGTLSFY